MLDWCLDKPGVRRALASRIAKLDEQLAPRLPELTAFSAEQLAAHGVLSQDLIGQLASVRIATTKARAVALLADDVVLAA